MKNITLDAITNNVEKVVDFINAELESADCSMKAQMQIDVAVDEIFANISSYAYGDETGEATISIDFDNDSSSVIIKFIDSGMKYNPLENRDPDVTLSADEREIGGLGIFLVKKTMDLVEYEYIDNKNVLTIKKKIF